MTKKLLKFNFYHTLSLKKKWNYLHKILLIENIPTILYTMCPNFFPF